MVIALLVIIGVLTLLFLVFWIKDLVQNKDKLDDGGSWIVGLIIGFITDFLDTLGIGSFAPTTMLYKFTKYLRSDEFIPGTLNIGHSIPVVTEAFIFINAVEVEPVTLFSLIAAATIGAVVGAKIVSKLPEKKIQVVMGVCLLFTAVLMVGKILGWLDLLGEGNTAIALHGILLIVAIAINFVLGGLMMAGVGLYAPCMVMVYLMGMSPKVAFPIMMGSCAGLMVSGSIEFIRKAKYSRRAAICLTAGGIFGVFVAAYLVVSMPIEILTWLIVCVVVYTGISMIIAGTKKPAVTA